GAVDVAGGHGAEAVRGVGAAVLPGEQVGADAAEAGGDQGDDQCDDEQHRRAGAPPGRLRGAGRRRPVRAHRQGAGRRGRDAPAVRALAAGVGEGACAVLAAEERPLARRVRAGTLRAFLVAETRLTARAVEVGARTVTRALTAGAVEVRAFTAGVVELSSAGAGTVGVAEGGGRGG